jgi:flagellar motor protein MotB
MQGARGWVVLALVAGLAGVMGCKSGGGSVTRAEFDALKKHNADLMETNSNLQAEAEAMRTREAETPRTPVMPAKTGGFPSADQFGPGATFDTSSGQPVIRIEGGLVNYGSGKAGVSPDGKRVLDRVASALNSTYGGRMVQVEGHTDSDPINKTKNLYKSNWELGLKRATEVVDYLVSRGVDPRRLRATSFGEHRPISTDKSRNRRVEIVVMPQGAYGFPGGEGMSSAAP